jgi:glucose-1-phosphate thymidylyltransferase
MFEVFGDGWSSNPHAPTNPFNKLAHTTTFSVVAVHTIDKLEDGGKYGSIELDEFGRITFFKEKPIQPKSFNIAVALYYYPKSSLELIRRYMAEENNLEEPGLFVEWMYKLTPFYTFQVPGIWCDIGSKEKLEEANRIFARVNKVAT